MADVQQDLVDSLNKLLQDLGLDTGSVSQDTPKTSLEILSKPAQTPFQFSAIPPQGIYVHEDELLQLSLATLLPTKGVIFNGTFITPKGELIKFGYTLAASSAGLTQYVIDISEVFILDMSITLTSFTESSEQVRYAWAQTIEIDGSLVRPQKQIVSGFVTDRRFPTFGGAVEGSAQHQDTYPRVVSITSPGAGAEWVFDVPDSLSFELYAVHFVLTTSAAVANRRCNIQATKDIGEFGLWRPASTQAAGIARAYMWANWGNPEILTVNTFNEPLPAPIILPTGTRLQSITDNMQAGDAYTFVNLSGIWRFNQ